ncbi:hypothetical protein A2960_00030 [Candidatus Gottesmanbacteria bacterium RIFCSPLOWO2_01_FULL_39_12b]|uniref:Antitoxin n=1 Tax=Candidatus Gottesmanbacteria bacterium RIFCSPLOWO2_01_FULL_39_12b TaxID=1798388 RepID=A0A1F6ARP0_9BACT|nr:MAG: hypothetical protein A2960_00030 [Candidatus Gottesmanbacteria bacterium RIFCSPLOWO2_01_FULL_39_12b]
MQTLISKSQFKPKVLEYLRLVEKLDQPLTITHEGKPVVQVVPYQITTDLTKELIGSVIRYEDPTKPVPLNEWEVLK